MPRGKDWKILNKTSAMTATEYQKTIKEINKIIKKAFDKYSESGLLSMAQMQKRNRLSKMTKEITKSIDKLVKNRNSNLRIGLNKTFKYSFKRLARSVEKQVGETLGLKLPPAAVVVANDGNLSSTQLLNDAKTKANIKRTITTGLNTTTSTADGILANGLSYRDFTKSIKKTMSKDYGRYVRVLRAEGTRINSSAKNAVWNEIHDPKLYKKQIVLFQTPKPDDFIKLIGAGEKTQTVKLYGGTSVQLGDLMIKVWIHDSPKTPRPGHLAAHGQYADENGMFHVNGYTVEAPGMFGDPAEDVNCLCSVGIEKKKIKK